MKHRIYGTLGVLGLLFTTACGGGGGSTAVTPPVTTQPGSTTQATAKSTVTMTIPLGSSGYRMPSAQAISAGGSRTPMFVDGSSNGNVTVYFDGTTVISFPTSGYTAPGAGPSGNSSLNNGGSFSWTSQIVTEGSTNQLAAVITGNYDVVPGSHTIGAVQTNGPCYAQDTRGALCIENTSGYILAEGQTTLTLQPGNNNMTPLVLRGVMESVYICDTGCDAGTGQVDSNGFFHVYVVVADENGTAIPYQLDGNNQPVPFDNGSYTLHDTANILTINNAGPFSTPSTDHNSSYGANVGFKCNTTGTTTLYAQLNGGGAPTNPVNGVTPTVADYPAANMILGTVGADEWYGNELQVNCNATGSVVIE